MGSLNRTQRGVGVREVGKEGGEGEPASKFLAYHCKMGLAFALPL